MRAVGYVRVSTDEQAESGLSVVSQRDQVEGYAKLYKLELVEVCSDEGYSGSHLDRPGLGRAIELLEDGRAEALVVAKLDRLTRSLRDLLELVGEYFSGRFSLMSVSEQLDPRTPSGRLTISILAAVAQWELETIRERTRSALAQKRARGEYTGGFVPYGYCLDPSNSRRLVRHAREQRVLHLARDLRTLQHLSYREIAESLEFGRHFPRGGGHWSPNQIRRLLRSGHENEKDN